MMKHEENTSITRPTVVDLFSGAGGMSLGFESAGFDIVGAIEMDPIHALIHHYNFPYTKTICRNISEISNGELERILEERGLSSLDVIVGGPPCQGFSQIGKRQLDDPRNRLVFEFVRAVRVLKPKYFVFENVPGLAAGQHKKFLNEIIEEFSRVGYEITFPYQVLNSASFGVAQKRRRLIIIGSRTNSVNYPMCTHEEQSGQRSLFENLVGYVGSKTALHGFENFKVFIGDDAGVPVNSVKYNGWDGCLAHSENFFNSHKRSIKSDWFEFHRTIWHGFRQIGNAVTPFMARAIAQQILISEGNQSVLWPTMQLDSQDQSLLTMDMSSAASYWGVSREVIPPRKRLVI